MSVLRERGCLLANRFHGAQLDRSVSCSRAFCRSRSGQASGMLNQKKGYVDHVLWDDDGKPLTVVEAKRTTKDPEA